MYLDNKTQPPNSMKRGREGGKEGGEEGGGRGDRKGGGLVLIVQIKRWGGEDEVEGVGALPDFTPLL